MNVTVVDVFVLSQTPVVCKRDHVFLALAFFLLAYGGVQRILYCIFALVVFVLFTLFLWNAHVGIPLGYFPAFI